MNIEVGDSFSTAVTISAGQTISVPIALAAGSQAITLTLQAGNFQPSEYGQKDTCTLSFAVNAIDLQHMMGLPYRVPPAMEGLMKERLEG